MARPDEIRTEGGNNAEPRSIPRADGGTIFDYRLIDKIGEGNYGTVWRAERDSFIVALKELNKPLDSKETQDELKSLETLKRLHHKFILHTENFWAEAGRLYIEMEHADGGSLKDRLKAYKAMGKPGIPEDELLKFFTETAQAIDYLHRQTPVILHRDIKPGNILLVNGAAKIADFGLLRQVSGDKSATKTQGGTLLYLAPEAIASDVASIHTDLFSFAVTYAELRQGSLPFTGKSIGQIYDKIRWEPPELSDIFHPEEKKILLKALDKEPKNRHATCYDFVFQLNRVVPWTPALAIPVLPTQPININPETKATDGKAHAGPTHMTVHRKPVPTQQDVSLPPEDSTSTPLSSTDAPTDGTVKEPRRSVPAAPTAHAGFLTPGDTDIMMPTLQTPAAAAPAPVPKYRPRQSRRRRRAPLIGAALLVMLVAGIAAGSWFVAKFGFRRQVEVEIKKRDFRQALDLIQNAKPWQASEVDGLRDQIATAWWDDVKVAGPSDVDSLKKQLRNLKDFQEAFPGREGIEGRREAAMLSLGEAIAAEVDRLLERRKPADAQALVTSNQSYLPNDAGRFFDQIKKKQDVLNALTAAERKLQGKDFEGCQEAFQLVKTPFKSVRDRNDKEDMLRRAEEGIQARNDMDSRLVKELETLANDKTKLPEVRQKLQDIAAFRDAYPLKKNAWRPSDVELAKRFDPARLGIVLQIDAAWDALKRDDLKDCQAKLDSVKAHLVQVPKSDDLAGYQKEYALLQALLQANESEGAAAEVAATSLLEQVARHKPPAPLAVKLWAALAQLEERKDFFTFKSLEDLQSAEVLAKASDKGILAANAKILAHFLERTLKAKSFAWVPSPAQQALCLKWIARIDPPLRPYVLALKAECLVATSASVKELKQVKLPIKADWYGGYVQALIEEKFALSRKGDDAIEQYGHAADDLSDAVSDRPAALGAARTPKAVALLRGAIASVREGDIGQWTHQTKAKRVLPWFNLMFDLLDATETTPKIDDLHDYAFVLVEAGKSGMLKDVSKRLEAGKFTPAEKLRGYRQIALAQRLMAELARDEIESLYAKAFALPIPIDNAERQAVAKEALAYIKDWLQDADRDYNASKYPDAIAKAKRCASLLRDCAYKWRAFDLAKDTNLETLASLHGNAVLIRALSATYSSGDGARYYEAVKDAVQKQPRDDGLMVPVLVKLPIYAPLNDRSGDFAKDMQTALSTAKRLMETRPLECGADWRKWYCEGEYQFGDWLQRKLSAEIEAKKLDWEKDKAEVAKRNQAIRGYFESARSIQRNDKLAIVEEWELDWQIGYTYYVLAVDDKKSAEVAQREFRSALAGMKKARKEKENEKLKAKIEKFLKNLDKVLDASPNSSLAPPARPRLDAVPMLALGPTARLR